MSENPGQFYCGSRLSRVRFELVAFYSRNEFDGALPGQFLRASSIYTTAALKILTIITWIYRQKLENNNYDLELNIQLLIKSFARSAFIIKNISSTFSKSQHLRYGYICAIQSWSSVFLSRAHLSAMLCFGVLSDLITNSLIPSDKQCLKECTSRVFRSYHRLYNFSCLKDVLHTTRVLCNFSLEPWPFAWDSAHVLGLQPPLSTSCPWRERSKCESNERAMEKRGKRWSKCYSGTNTVNHRANDTIMILGAKATLPVV